MNLLKWLVHATVTTILLACPLVVQAQNVVVPNGLENTEGNINNGYPFNIDNFGQASQRYQQVYLSSQFGALTSPAYITAISFRPDDLTGNSFSETFSNIQINLSTTAAGIDLSFTFADNVGADDTLVHSGALTISSSFTGTSPKDFDIVINLQTPFLYDPSLGNLLMDVRNFGGGTTSQFDASNNSPDSIARIYTEGSDVNSLEADGGQAMGLVTQFTFAAVPEPTTWALMGLAICGTGGFLWKKRMALKQIEAMRFSRVSR